ncbi:MAG TPA: PrsW family glutamic-type intramembrane protease [Ktedonobacterales bacterium]|nr:PrsW family glutamic-type intramembrane protease [Ktedonobacterales bacterium]
MNRRRRRNEVSQLAADLALPSAAALRAVPNSRQQSTRGRRGQGPSCFLNGSSVMAIRGDAASIGRALFNTVVVVDPTVSREHAHLRRASDGWIVTNVSAHESLWAGDRCVAPGGEAPVLPGESLRLGTVSLQLVAPLFASAPPAGASFGEAESAGEVEAGDARESSASSGTHVLAPGITLQFAAEAARAATRWRLVGAAALLVAMASAVVTLGIAVAAGASAAANGPWQVLAALTVPLAPVLGAALVAVALDRYEREPVLLLAAAFVWGALIAIAPAVVVERLVTQGVLALLHTAGPHAVLGEAAARALTAGVIEEGVKGVGLVLLLAALRDEFDNVTDGILYGLLIGAGFALVENFAYVAQSPRDDLPFLILGRIVLGWLGHSTFTALLGAGLGYAREARRSRWRWVAPVGGALAAVLLHTWFDFVAFATTALAPAGTVNGNREALALASLALAYLPLFAAQAVLLRLALAALGREAETIRAFLAPEVIGGAVSPDEYVLLQDARMRGWAERRIFAEVGWHAYLTARALHQTATGLAFWKWHTAASDVRWSGAERRERAYRERIARLRRSLVRQLTESLLAEQASM